MTRTRGLRRAASTSRRVSVAAEEQLGVVGGERGEPLVGVGWDDGEGLIPVLAQQAGGDGVAVTVLVIDARGLEHADHGAGRPVDHRRATEAGLRPPRPLLVGVDLQQAPADLTLYPAGSPDPVRSTNAAGIAEQLDLPPGLGAAGELRWSHPGGNAPADDDQPRDVAVAGAAGGWGHPPFHAGPANGVGQRELQVHDIPLARSFLGALTTAQGQVHHVGAGENVPLRDESPHPYRAVRR